MSPGAEQIHGLGKIIHGEFVLAEQIHLGKIHWGSNSLLHKRDSLYIHNAMRVGYATVAFKLLRQSECVPTRFTDVHI